MQRSPLYCWQCGTVVSAPGGRCPTCGAEQPNAPTTTAPAPAPGPEFRSVRPVPAPTPKPNKALPWVVLGVGLAAIGTAATLLSPGRRDGSSAAASANRPPPAAAAPRPVDPNDLGIQNPAAVDPSDVLGRAKTRALVWSKDAVLASIRARPVVNGKVDLTGGGTVEYVYGKPTGEGFGAGARIAGKRLRITLTGSGTKVDEIGGGPLRAAMEPNCPLDEAVQKVEAAGIPRNTPLSAVYEVSDKHQKAVWRLSGSGDDATSRTLDGMSCAILVR
jgi:hypothetical protein